MKLLIAAAVAAVSMTGAAWAGPCSDQIKALQESASKTDAKNKPGNQAKPTDTGEARTAASDAATSNNASPAAPKPSEAAPKGAEGGGTVSASAKILEAQAYDQRGEEAKCMDAVDAAKKLIDS